MPDREKVLKALEHHKETAVCNGCPYEEDDDTVEGYCPIYDDAIALLIEQKPIKPIKKFGIVEAYKCGACEWVLGWVTGFPLYCPRCGRKVDWNA